MAIELFIGFATLVLTGVCLGIGITLMTIVYSESFRNFIKGEIHEIELREEESL